MVFASYSGEKNIADDIDVATPYSNLQEKERQSSGFFNSDESRTFTSEVSLLVALTVYYVTKWAGLTSCLGWRHPKWTCKNDYWAVVATFPLDEDI